MIEKFLKLQRCLNAMAPLKPKQVTNIFRIEIHD